MDKARFYALVMGKKKDELQGALLQLGEAAYLLAQDVAVTNRDGTLAPAKDQPDEQVKTVLSTIGL
jgi:hypothetical protein